MQMPLAFAFVILLITPALADPLPRDTQIVRVGPCAIATTYKADRFRQLHYESLGREP